MRSRWFSILQAFQTAAANIEAALAAVHSGLRPRMRFLTGAARDADFFLGD